MSYFDLIICGKPNDVNRYLLRAPAWTGINPGETVGFVFPGTDAMVEERVLSVSTTSEDSELYRCITAVFPKHKIVDAEYVLHKKNLRKEKQE